MNGEDKHTNTGNELTKLSFFTEDSSSIGWRTFGTYTYVGVDGELLTNPTSWRIGGGGGFYDGPFNPKNLTDSSFSYSGVDILIDFDFYELRSGSGVSNLMEWSSSAEDIQIIDTTPLPEPRTLGLLAIGLAGIAWIKRRPRRSLAV